MIPKIVIGRLENRLVEVLSKLKNIIKHSCHWSGGIDQRRNHCEYFKQTEEEAQLEVAQMGAFSPGLATVRMILLLMAILSKSTASSTRDVCLSVVNSLWKPL